MSLAKINDNHNIDGLVQDCSNSIANALEFLQSCTKPSIYSDMSVRLEHLQPNIFFPPEKQSDYDSWKFEFDHH